MSGRPWLRKLAWIAFLVPFFFLTYNFANYAASQRAHVAELMFSWERHIPFLSWTILPYWSSDLLYLISLIICTTRPELDLHGKRLLAIQVFSVACFLAFPLRFAVDRPPVTGWEGHLFATLLSFDRPFNQAPSLHVGLAVILWSRYRAHTFGMLRIAVAAWFLLIAVSTLTTYQHHFIDLPTGAWAGVLATAALPERRNVGPQIRLTLIYLAAAVVCTVGAFELRGFGWLLLWPGFALSMVAAAYWTGDPIWLGKHDRPSGALKKALGNRLPYGRGSVSTSQHVVTILSRAREQAVPGLFQHPVRALLMIPFTAGAWINSRVWTHGEPARSHLLDAVWIGRAPSPRDRDGMNSVVDLAPELSIRGDAHVAMLDLMPPTEDQLDAAVSAINGLAKKRPTLVCCALGYSRSAIVGAAWLMAIGSAANVEDALRQVRRARPQVVITPKLKLRLEQWAERRNGNAG